MIMAFWITSVCACSNSKNYNETTGSACSIKDLNNLYDKNTVKAKAVTTDSDNRSLRPVPIFDKPLDNENYTFECRFGLCLKRCYSRPTK